LKRLAEVEQIKPAVATHRLTIAYSFQSAGRVQRNFINTTKFFWFGLVAIWLNGFI
jgi:hypothetical protein